MGITLSTLIKDYWHIIALLVSGLISVIRLAIRDAQQGGQIDAMQKMINSLSEKDRTDDHERRIAVIEGESKGNNILLVQIQKEIVALNTKVEIYFKDK